MADVYVNALTTISTEPTTTDSLVAVNRNTNEGKIIDYNLLADDILNKITSKQFSGLTTTSKLLTGAINELDSDVSSLNSSIDNLEPIILAISANSSATVQGYSASNSDRRLLIFAHSTNTALCGLYIALSSSVVAPIIEATGLTVTASGGVITIQNNTASAANGIVMT